METKTSTIWLDISNAYERGELRADRKGWPIPNWLNNRFIDENCMELDEEEEEMDGSNVSVSEQLYTFYEPLYKVAKKRVGSKLNREIFYVWMQELLKY